MILSKPILFFAAKEAEALDLSGVIICVLVLLHDLFAFDI